MRSFLLLTGGLLLAAASIFAVPVDTNFEVRPSLDTMIPVIALQTNYLFQLRSSSSASRADSDSIFARAVCIFEHRHGKIPKTDFSLFFFCFVFCKVQHISFGHDVPHDHRASITAAIQAYHNNLAGDHAASGAVQAHVIGKGWHANKNDEKVHTTVRFFRGGHRNSRTHLHTEHVYPH